MDGARPLEVVEVRRGEPWARSVDFDACRLKSHGEGERDRVEGCFRRAVSAEHLAMRDFRVRVPRERAALARDVDNASRRGFKEECQHRLCYSNEAKYVRLEDSAHIVKRRDGQKT